MFSVREGKDETGRERESKRGREQFQNPQGGSDSDDERA